MAYLDDESGLDELELDFVPAEVKREYDTLPTADYVVDIESIKPSWNEANDVILETLTAADATKVIGVMK